MIVYKCAITGDELFTDIYKIEDKDGFYIVKGKLVTRKKGDDISDDLIGGNKSAEEPQESTDSSDETESGCNIVLDNRLAPTGFGTKKEYTAYFKTYVKALLAKKKEKEPEKDFTEWQAQITAAFKVAAGNFGEFEFFTGSSGDPSGIIALQEWKTPEGETDESPYVWFYKEGVIEEKC